MSERNISGEVTTLVTLMVDLEKEAEGLVAQSEAKLRESKRIAREDLPELMREAELSELKLTDGTEVSIREVVNAGISEGRKPAALAWLQKNGFGGLIKSNISIEFGASPEEHEAALKLGEKLCAELERTVQVAESVHPGTLKAFIKEQLEAGANVPRELFGVFVFSEAKVKKAKPKRN